MTPTAQEAAEQVFKEVSTTRCPHDTEIFALEQNCTICLLNALTTFAHARERAVWEEAANLVECDSPGCSCNTTYTEPCKHCMKDCQDCNLAIEFRRRATHAEGKETP